MSGYGWENGPPRRRRAANVFIVLAVLLPLTVAGWLVWHAVQGAGGGTDGDDKAAGAAPTLLPGPGGQADDGQRGDAHGSDGQKDSGRQDGGQADGGHEDSRQRENGKKELPLRGRTVVIDPGHNPHNSEHPEEIARRVDIGTVKKE